MTGVSRASATAAQEAGPSPLDRESPIPLYVQIKRHLLALIATWDGKDDRFYTDNELCRMFGVSRMTARQAVQELVGEGFLRRVRGFGTFIAPQKVEERFTPLMNFRDQWASRGRPMRIAVLAFEQRPCPAESAEILGLEAGAPVRYIRRLRFSGDVPIAIDHRYVPLALAATLAPEDAERSILHALWEHFDLCRGELQIEASTADEAQARLLRMVPGDPILVRHLRYVDSDGRAVMVGHSCYRADLVRYALTVPLARAGSDAEADPEVDGRVAQLTREVGARSNGTRASGS